MIQKQKESALQMIKKLNEQVIALDDKLTFYENLLHDEHAEDTWKPSLSVPKPRLQMILDMHNNVKSSIE